MAIYRGRLFAMGGGASVLEQGVPQQHAPMLTPRHAVGATVLGDGIYVAGGGAVLGGSLQSAVHEAFVLE